MTRSLSRGAGKKARGADGNDRTPAGLVRNPSIFSFADDFCDGNAHMARMLVLYLYNQEKVASTRLGCVQLRCSAVEDTPGIYFTPVFDECLETRAVLSLDTGRLYVQTKSKKLVFFDIKECIWTTCDFARPLRLLGITESHWNSFFPRPWLAFPWWDSSVVRVYVSEYLGRVVVRLLFVFQHLFEREQQRSLLKYPHIVNPFLRYHGELDLRWRDTPVPYVLSKLHLGILFLPAEELWRRRTLAVFLAYHPRVGSLSRIRVLDVETLRRIMQIDGGILSHRLRSVQVVMNLTLYRPGGPGSCVTGTMTFDHVSGSGEGGGAAATCAGASIGTTGDSPAPRRSARLIQAESNNWAESNSRAQKQRRNIASGLSGIFFGSLRHVSSGFHFMPEMFPDHNSSGAYCDTGDSTRWIVHAKAMSDFSAAAITLRNQVVDGFVCLPLSSC